MILISKRKLNIDLARVNGKFKTRQVRDAITGEMSIEEVIPYCIYFRWSLSSNRRIVRRIDRTE